MKISELLNSIRLVLKQIFGAKSPGTAPPDVAISSAMTHAIELWDAEYKGRPDRTKQKHIRSINIGAAVASEIARLVTIEFKSEITGSKRAEALNVDYQNFLDKIRIYTEFACAKGGIIFKPYVSGDKICVNAVQADAFYPTAYDNAGNITGAVFLERYTQGGTYYTRLEYHSLSGKSYSIINEAYASKDNTTLGSKVSLDSVSAWSDIAPEAELSNVSAPLFSYFRIPNANYIDSESPLGISVFAKAIPLIRDADEIYSSLVWEFKSGQRKIFVDEMALRKDENSCLKMPELEDGVVVTLDSTDPKFYQAFSPELRDEPIRRGLNEVLRRIETLCGVAYGTLSDVQDTAKTATEIKASKQRTYSTVTDIQKALKSSLHQLAEAMNYYAELYNLSPSGSYEISFDFDDSIIVDTEAEQKIWFAEVGAGLIRPTMYLMKRYGVTEEQATEMLPEAFGGDE